MRDWFVRLLPIRGFLFPFVRNGRQWWEKNLGEIERQKGWCHLFFCRLNFFLLKHLFARSHLLVLTDAFFFSFFLKLSSSFLSHVAKYFQVSFVKMAKHCLSQPPKQHPSFGTFRSLIYSLSSCSFLLSHPSPLPSFPNGPAAMLNTLFDNPPLTPVHETNDKSHSLSDPDHPSSLYPEATLNPRTLKP